MNYDKKDPSTAESALAEPVAAYGAGVGRAAVEPWAVYSEDWDADNPAHDDCECPLCREKRIPYEQAARANKRLDAGYDKHAELLIECRRRGYNEETIDAIKESLDADDGKITLKSYDTVEEMMADILSEEDDD